MENIQTGKSPESPRLLSTVIGGLSSFGRAKKRYVAGHVDVVDISAELN
jgi:hypothetical protein